MSKPIALVLAALLGGLAAVPSALAQTTTLTMSSWVSPQHHLTANVLVGWANEVEKATNGRVKFTMLPKHPSAPPGTFDAVRDGRFYVITHPKILASVELRLQDVLARRNPSDPYTFKPEAAAKPR